MLLFLPSACLDKECSPKYFLPQPNTKQYFHLTMFYLLLFRFQLMQDEVEEFVILLIVNELIVFIFPIFFLLVK